MLVLQLVRPCQESLVQVNMLRHREAECGMSTELSNDSLTEAFGPMATEILLILSPMLLLGFISYN
jgi:hypothetical protein